MTIEWQIIPNEPCGIKIKFVRQVGCKFSASLFNNFNDIYRKILLGIS